MNLIDGLNIEYIHVLDRELEAKMNLTQFHDQTFGYLHGGATIAFGETITGYASLQKINKDQVAVGQTITANHMKAKKIEGYIIAKGKLIHVGKTSHVWSVEMFDENNVLISFMTVTNAIIKSNKDNPFGKER
ncbi:PaaI family thioesterase [Clostridium estertheticum]|uniref:PaaI family thioesterase n=1 Tax=Clostridium estertheticum TaxID=238834 RepID=A0AA47EFR8_9CLOT|nr:PaaI family thioesterase [Clostridium estertheticum]MBU3155907.1 PaaI family thioesterase [Clostridium estertheticum]MBU3200520.1 PaaI family thioesterase [Clostridium estertheticum]MCB2353594.1 PaaI family thioesterase [Clostridium estertheticum]WAG40696.1 PaaI family thioesterase [Clostridium estertheticum]WAG59186.1 PaaI family thioesterase [Clostridium estertheticum]